MKHYQKFTQSLLKSFTKLTQKKFRQSERKFLVEGVHLVEEALKSDWEVEAIIVAEDFKSKQLKAKSQQLRAESGEHRVIQIEVPIYIVSGREFEKISDTVSSQGIVAVVKMKDYSPDNFWKALPIQSILVALDNVADPGNVGTIIRTCDWFGVDGVLLSKDTVDLFNPKVVRGTMGAIFHLGILSDVDLRFTIQDARTQGFKVITTVLEGGKSLNEYTFPDKSLIVLGNEAHGVSKEIAQMADASITIPKYGQAESLNVAISCGIVLNAARTSII